MKKILLCSIAVLCVAASIFGGYYFFVNDAVQKTEEPQSQLTEANKEEPGATYPERAAQWRADAWRDENGVVSTYGLANAVEQRDAYLAAHNPPDGFGDKEVARMNWLPVGPQNAGGRTRSLVFDPIDTTGKTMWAGAVSGGVWKSVNAGKSWTAMNGGLQNFSVNCMAIDYTDGPNVSRPILWAGTGEGFSNPGLSGGGLFKSTNGGLNWTAVSQSVDRKWQYIDSLAVTHYNGQTIMLAGVEPHPEFPNERGIMRSENGGVDWERVYDAVTSFSIVVDPSNPGNVIAEVRSPDGFPHLNKNRVIYSEDAGETWQTAKRNGADFETNRPYRIVKLLFYKANSNIVYAQAVAEGPFEPSTIYKSEDGGKNYNIQLGGVPTYSDYKSSFWVSPIDSNLMIAGGTQLYRSVNGGVSFDPIAGGADLNDIPHDDHQNSVTSPAYSVNNKQVYILTDGGIYRSDDIQNAIGTPSPDVTYTATPASTPGGWLDGNGTYQTTQFFSAAGDFNSGLISGGTQDQGTLRVTLQNPNARKLFGADGGSSAVDENICYGQVISGLWRNSNCSSPTSPQENLYHTGMPDLHYGGDRAAMKVDPNNPDRFFFGLSSVWRSDNIRDAVSEIEWTEIKPNPLFTATPTATSTGTPSPTATPTASPTAISYRPVVISAMDVHPSHPNIVWVAERNPFEGWTGKLYKTTNATASPGGAVEWNTIDDNIPSPTATPTATPSGTPVIHRDPLPNRQILKILIDKDNPHIVYVGLAGAAEDNLWRTTDGGDSWMDITGDNVGCQPVEDSIGLPCLPINAIALDPHNSAKIYVGTDIGIYTNGIEEEVPGTQWWPLMTGPANVKISDLNFLKGSNKLLAATYGRGLWVADLDGGVGSEPVINDFDGDGRSDLAVVREDSAHKMWHLQGSTEAYRSQEFGNTDDQVAAADYDGDGRTDVAVYRGSEQKFYCLRSSDNTLAVTQLGSSSSQADITASADFDGDDLADEAVFDPYTGVWKVEQSENGHLTFQWGAAGDKPVSMDFDGDGQADFGVFHEADGVITLRYNANGVGHEKQFGLEGDVAVPGEYDGDGKIDLAVWRPDDDGEGNGCWYITYGADGYVEYDAIPWGMNGDVPVAGDYDGDGKLDIAVWRSSTGMYQMLQSSNGYYSERFGAAGDIPVGIKAVYDARPSGGSFSPAPPNAMPRRRTHHADDLQQTAAY